MNKNLIEHFSVLQDPRIERNKRHELMDIIVLVICSVVSGAEGWTAIAKFGHEKLEWLRKFRSFKELYAFCNLSGGKLRHDHIQLYTVGGNATAYCHLTINGG